MHKKIELLYNDLKLQIERTNYAKSLALNILGVILVCFFPLVKIVWIISGLLIFWGIWYYFRADRLVNGIIDPKKTYLKLNEIFSRHFNNYSDIVGLMSIAYYVSAKENMIYLRPVLNHNDVSVHLQDYTIILSVVNSHWLIQITRKKQNIEILNVDDVKGNIYEQLLSRFLMDLIIKNSNNDILEKFIETTGIMDHLMNIDYKTLSDIVQNKYKDTL